MIKWYIGNSIVPHKYYNGIENYVEKEKNQQNYNHNNSNKIITRFLSDNWILLWVNIVLQHMNEVNKQSAHFHSKNYYLLVGFIYDGTWSYILQLSKQSGNGDFSCQERITIFTWKYAGMLMNMYICFDLWIVGIIFFNSFYLDCLVVEYMFPLIDRYKRISHRNLSGQYLTRTDVCIDSKFKKLMWRICNLFFVNSDIFVPNLKLKVVIYNKQYLDASLSID